MQHRLYGRRMQAYSHASCVPNEIDALRITRQLPWVKEFKRFQCRPLSGKACAALKKTDSRNVIYVAKGFIEEFWTGAPSVAFFIAYTLLLWKFFSAQPVTLCMPLFNMYLIPSPTLTQLAIFALVALVAIVGHKEMALGVAGAKSGPVLDGISYGTSAAMFTALVWHLPSVFFYMYMHPFVCLTVVSACIITVVAVCRRMIGLEALLWHYRWHGQFSRLIIMAILLLAIPGTVGLPAQTAIDAPASKDDRTLEANMDTAAVFFDGSWNNLSLQQRLDALGTMSVVLSDHLGISNPPARIVATTNMGANTLGYYNHSGDGLIAVNAAHLMSDSPLVALDTVSHEMAHVFQHEALCAGGRPQSSSYPFIVDREKLEGYLISYSGIQPYEERVTEQEAFEFAAHYSRIVSKKVCRRLQIEDPLDIRAIIARAYGRRANVV